MRALLALLLLAPDAVEGLAQAPAQQAPDIEAFRKRTRVEQGRKDKEPWVRVCIDDVPVLACPGQTAAVDVVKSKKLEEQHFISIRVDGAEVLRLWGSTLGRPLRLPRCSLPDLDAIKFVGAPRVNSGADWVFVTLADGAGAGFLVYHGPGQQAIGRLVEDPERGKRYVVEVDGEVVYLAPAGARADVEGFKDRPRVVGEALVKSLAEKFKAADAWAMRAIILTSLGSVFHPSASGMLREGLLSRDLRLRAYAVETLRRADDETLASVLSKELVDNLLHVQLKVKNPLFVERVTEVVRRLAPAGTKDLARWWSDARLAWQTPPWEEPPQAAIVRAGPGETTAEGFVNRAFDLFEAGLDVAICIDSTSSMQGTIDAAREGLEEIVAVLRGVSPRLRLGLVHYRDVEDFKDGAELLMPLTEAVERAQAVLEGLKAVGGGDIPERVEKGLGLALDPARMGWALNTNKVVLLVGDAPPHPEDVGKAVELVKAAYERPFGKRPDVATGTKRTKSSLRTFVTSTIAVGYGGRASADTESAFRKIAEAGGGAYAVFPVEIPPRPAPPGAPAGPPKPPPAPPKPEAAGGIVRHILTLSFGPEWAQPMGTFVATYQEYRRAKTFK